jgi:hypothetical protein
MLAERCRGLPLLVMLTTTERAPGAMMPAGSGTKNHWRRSWLAIPAEAVRQSKMYSHSRNVLSVALPMSSGF